MSIKLSKRMKCIVDMVTPGRVVADIGCDHGYISIYLIEEGIAKKVYAMDVAEGPLSNAKESIAVRGLSDKIKTFISDGFDELEEGLTDCAVIAGMGGMLMIDIISRGLHKINAGYQLVLSPQSDIPLVRTYLREHGFSIIDEDMLSEDGKYYNIIKAELMDGDTHEAIDDDMQLLYDMYGEKLIEKKHPVLREYLEKQMEKYQGIFCRLSKSTGDGAADRMSQIRNELGNMEKVMQILEDTNG